jgi:hypothetical protein
MSTLSPAIVFKLESCLQPPLVSNDYINVVSNAFFDQMNGVNIHYYHIVRFDLKHASSMMPSSVS